MNDDNYMFKLAPPDFTNRKFESISEFIDNNLSSIVTSIGLDHLDWLPKNEQTIDKIIFEKTSSLLNSNIIISKQTSKDILDKI